MQPRSLTLDGVVRSVHEAGPLGRLVALCLVARPDDHCVLVVHAITRAPNLQQVQMLQRLCGGRMGQDSPLFNACRALVVHTITRKHVALQNLKPGLTRIDRTIPSGWVEVAGATTVKNRSLKPSHYSPGRGRAIPSGWPEEAGATAAPHPLTCKEDNIQCRSQSHAEHLNVSGLVAMSSMSMEQQRLLSLCIV